MAERGKRSRPAIDAELTERYEKNSKEFTASIGERLRLRREYLKLSQEAVVRKLQYAGLDIARSTYGKYETGEIEMSATIMLQVAEALQTTISHLTGEDENLPNKQELSAFLARLARLHASLPPKNRGYWSQNLLDLAEVMARQERLRDTSLGEREDSQ